MKTRWMTVLLSALMLLSLAACTPKQSATSSATNAAASTVAATTAPAETATSTATIEATIAPTEKPVDPFAKYSPEIVMTVGQFVGDDKMFPDGETPSANKAYSMVKDNIGIKFETKFTAPYGDPFNEKLRQQINTNDIPDFCTAQVSDIETLIKGDMIVDLAPYIEKYGSPATKQMIFYKNNVLIKPVTRGDKIYGLPATVDINNGVGVLYIRKDWMDKVGAAAPQSIEDVVALAKKFMENGLGKYGIAMSKESTALGYTGLMNSYGAYPRAFIKQDDGKITNGSIAATMLPALKSLQKLYADGIIDKEYMTKDGSKVAEEIVAGNVGIMIGEFWSPIWPLQAMVTADPKVDWNCYKLPGVGKAEVAPYAKIPVSGYAFVRAGYEHPEAAIIYLNNVVEELYNATSMLPFVTELKTTRTDVKYKNLNIYGWMPLQVDRPDKNINWSKNLIKAVEAKDANSLETPNEKELYTKITSGTADNWCVTRTYLNGIPTAASYQAVRYDDYVGAPTPTMLKQTGLLNGMEEEFVIKFISGQATDADFNAFTTQWLSNGGQQILDEINAGK